MASKQVALARAARPPVHVASTTRIPAFLNKLYEMVNDAGTTLIEWSPSGDTFYVYDQERFSREVLPHWFKHDRFPSFVRQLNMYGFHKIPHLHQGVLKSEGETEHWNFVHPNFRRDQPDLLCLIQRKKTGNATEEDKIDPATTPLPSAANGQLLDLQSIVNGLTAIKRHQTHISAELSELKRNNELLWQEAEAARVRHQKQQDTINRIVKFLAGLFGHANATVHKEDVRGSPPARAVVPRRQTRLMIEGGALDPNPKDEVESPAPFASIETPVSVPSPVESSSPNANLSMYSPTPSLSNLPADDQSNDIVSTQPQYPQASTTEGSSISPSRSPTNSDFDHLIQGALSTLTPAQIQQLMTSLNMPAFTELPGLGPEQNGQDSSLTSYQPPLDLSQLASFPLISSPSPPPTNLSGKADTSWRVSDIQHDVDTVDSKINHLFQQFYPNDGSSPSLDPTAFDPNPTSIVDPADTNSIDNELFTSFLNGLGDEPIIDADNETSTAFLDEIPSTDGANILPEQPPPKPAKKRKSNARDPASSDNDSSPDTRAKRRREG